MFLPLPPSSVADLAIAHQKEPVMPARRSNADPDGFFTIDSLQPDPIYLSLRNAVTTGPIGRLFAWIEVWRAAREEQRLAGEQTVAAAEQILRTNSLPQTTVARDRVEHDLAA
jgi:hypothetical protein